jgi:hypothetical protein
MMDRHGPDDDVRRLFGRNLPQVDVDQVWLEVRQEVGLRDPGPRRGRKRLRVALIGVGVVVAAAGLCVGVVEAVDYLSHPQPIIVLGDDNADASSPTDVSIPATSSTTFATVTAADRAWAAAKSSYESYLSALGIRDVTLERDPANPKGILAKVPEEKLSPPDAVFYNHRIERALFVATNELDLPYDECQVDSVAADGTVTNYSGFNPQQGFAYQPDWKSGQTVDEDIAMHMFGMVVRQLADGAGVINSDGSDMTYGSAEPRVLSLAVTLPAQNAETAYKAFLDQIFTALTQLNKQGCEIAMVELSIDDAQGDPVLRDVHDFELGAVGTWWDRLLPPWVDPPPSPTETSASSASLDPAQKQQLDGLNADDVVRWYMTATDPVVVLYLCAPRLQSEMTAPN